jgi:hypothetical protein
MDFIVGRSGTRQGSRACMQQLNPTEVVEWTKTGPSPSFYMFPISLCEYIHGSLSPEWRKTSSKTKTSTGKNLVTAHRPPTKHHSQSPTAPKDFHYKVFIINQSSTHLTHSDRFGARSARSEIRSSRDMAFPHEPPRLFFKKEQPYVNAELPDKAELCPGARLKLKFLFARPHHKRREISGGPAPSTLTPRSSRKKIIQKERVTLVNCRNRDRCKPITEGEWNESIERGTAGAYSNVCKIRDH